MFLYILTYMNRSKHNTQGENQMRRFAKLIFLLSFFIYLNLMSIEVFSQDEEPSSDSELEQRQLTAETEKAEYESMLKLAEVREKQAAILQNQITALKGNTTVKSAPIETEISGYYNVRCTARSLWESVDSAKIERLFVYDKRVTETISDYHIVKFEMVQLNSQFRDSIQALAVTNERLGGEWDEINTISSVGGLDVALGLASLLRSDITLAGTVSNPAKEELVAAFVQERPEAKKDVKVFFTERMIPTNLTSSNLVSLLIELKQVSDFVKDLKYLFDFEKDLRMRDALNKELKAAGTTGERKTEIRKLLVPINQRIVDFKRIHPQTDEKVVLKHAKLLRAYLGLYNQITGDLMISTKKKTLIKSSFAELLRAEMIIKVFPENGKSFWLDAKVVKSGGTVKTESSVLASLFVPGRRIKFSGGAIVSFVITGNNGEIMWSGIKTHYSRFKKSSKSLTAPPC